VKGQLFNSALSGGGTVASIALFWWVYGGLLTASPGSSVRAMSLLPLLAILLGYGWWAVCLVTGVLQLFTRPRWYGLLTIGCSAIQFIAVPVAVWMVMRARGIVWGS
jgi:hypothetical protein